MTEHKRMTGAALLLLAAVPLPASAQEVVQPLPPPGAQKLSDALDRLARNSQDVSAVLDAGDAALEVGDVDAAIGFFGRANQLSPGNSRVTLGLARAYVRSRRPIEALRLFAEAERTGIPDAVMAEERGLAFDLVGDAASAQQLYRLAISNGSGDHIIHRLALSLAISGNRSAFESTILPLLEKGDVSAFRVRAFGLAILGDTRAAVEIAETMLNPQTARQMRAYLEYMPQLTQAQQAAAANLGIFPRTGEIGTDDARIARYEQITPQPTEQPGAQLEPSGPRLGSEASPPRLEQDVQSPRARSSRRPTGDRLSGVRERRREASAMGQANPPLESTVPITTEATPTTPAPVIVAQSDERTAQSLSPAEVDRNSSLEPAILLPQPSSPQRATQPADVAAAFGDFTLPPASSSVPRTDAVDITGIDIPRERVEPKPPPPPAHPSRHWVQVATGKDRSALAFDWRRIARNADGRLSKNGPFVTPWGETNRLLAGPYDSAGKAREIVNELKELGVDSFPFTSALGEEIEALN